MKSFFGYDHPKLEGQDAPPKKSSNDSSSPKSALYSPIRETVTFEDGRRQHPHKKFPPTRNPAQKGDFNDQRKYWSHSRRRPHTLLPVLEILRGLICAEDTKADLYDNIVIVYV